MPQKSSSSLRAECRSRRSHRKSRNGCLTCKQRRKKCDEKQPSCTLCEVGLRTCIYANDRLSPGSSESGAASRSSSIPSPTPPLPGPFSSPLAQCRGPPSPRSPLSSTTAATTTTTHRLSQVGTGNGCGVTNISNVTDADLYLHFLNHTCKYAPSWDRDRIVLQVGIAKLALDSEPVSHSVLALSAACLCYDVMSTSGNGDVEAVGRILDRGLQHHTIALEQMRTMTSFPGESDIQPLLANALLLVPFAFAFQNIRHWVTLFPARGAAAVAAAAAAANTVTPRDAVLLLRGIRTTIDALNTSKGADRSGDDDNDDDDENKSRCPARTTPWDTIFSSQTMDSRDDHFTTSHPQSSHPMFPVLACTFHQAMAQLQCRIQNTLLATCPVDEKTASTLDTFDILSGLMSDTFMSSSDAARKSTIEEDPLENVAHNQEKVSVAPDSLLAQAPGWLRRFVLQRPRPTTTYTYTYTRRDRGEPFSRSFLAFFSRASKTYIDLLLPLLDPPTDDKVDEDGDERELTAAEVLALDVYGHWLALVLMVGKEAWWVGNFAYVALEGLIARYGDEFLGATSSIQEQWWPASMLEVAVRLRRRK